MRYLLTISLALFPLTIQAEDIVPNQPIANDVQVDDAYSPYRANQNQLTPPSQYQVPQELPQEEVIVEEQPEQEIIPEEKPETLQQPDIEGKKAKLQILDKINASVKEVEVEVDNESTISGLKIELKRCLHTPEKSKDENIAFLRIWQAESNEDEDYSDMIFSGWMFSSNPALHSVEHPIYDVVLLKCMD